MTKRPARERRVILLGSILLTVVSVAVTLLVGEFALRLLSNDPYMFDRRLMFFSEGVNFENAAWGGFQYRPNAAINASTYYVTNLDPARVELEYENQYTSNGLGLIQRNELDSLKPSILFLGDSFTEGQGAPPWFYALETNWPRQSPYQLINGAILATGLDAWGHVYHTLAPKFNVAKAVVIFIGDDWRRAVWKFPAKTLTCLQSSQQCIGDEDFYGLPSDKPQATAMVDRIAKYRIRYLEAKKDSTNFVTRSLLYKQLWAPASLRIDRMLHDGQDYELAQLEISKRVAKTLVDKLGAKNVVFVFLPQKHELDRNPSFWSRRAIDFITNAGYAFADGRVQCGITAQDFHVHDGHPNARGYEKIEKCIRRITITAFEADSSRTATKD